MKDGQHVETEKTDPKLGSILRWVIALNLATGLIEVIVALAIGSASLLADSTDFAEDATINLLVMVGLRWGARGRAQLGRGLALIIVAPGLAALMMIALRWRSGQPPEAVPLGLTGALALAVNATCAGLLAKIRTTGGGLIRAAYLSARNDVIANSAIVGTAAATVVTRSPWPDLFVGLAIVALNSGAAVEVWRAASSEGGPDLD